MAVNLLAVIIGVAIGLMLSIPVAVLIAAVSPGPKRKP